MTKKINILQITVRADIGGGPEHLYRLIKGMSPNFKNYIAAPNDEPYFDLFVNLVGENNCIQIPHRKFKISTLVSLVKLVKEQNISIIHSHGKGAGIYGRIVAFLSGRKSVHTLHGFHVGSYNQIQKLGYYVLEKILTKLTDKIIAVSEGEKNEVIAANVCNLSKITVIENGVEIPSLKVEQSNFGQSQKRIMCLTRFNFQKNAEALIEIARILKEKDKLGNFVFQVFGEGEDFEKVKNLINIENLNDSILLMGADSNARSKLVGGFCYISTSRWEGLPIALLEAMAVGLPVIASDVVGNNSIIENKKDGLLYNLESLESAANYILELSENIELWEKLSSNGSRKVKEHFSLAKMINKIEKIYEY